jgi:hypothetical protein
MLRPENVLPDIVNSRRCNMIMPGCGIKIAVVASDTKYYILFLPL